jgi:hypothetical protein
MNKNNKTLLLAGLALAAAMSTPIHALTINATFNDANISSDFGAANVTAFKSAFAFASTQFTSRFSDNINVNISVATAPGTSILGQSSTQFVGVGTGAAGYTILRSAAIADSTSADDFASWGAGGSLTATAPGSAALPWRAARAQMKALNLMPDDLTNDGTVTFGGGFSYDFDPTNGVGAGQYDLVSVMMHEISEVMGRFGKVGIDTATNPRAYLLDVFSFSGAGTRGFDSGTGNSFSIDGGTHLLKAFNSYDANGGDSRDWADVGGPADSFDAFGTTGVAEALSEVDLRALDVIGYDRISAVPLPATAWLMLSGLAALATVARGRRLAT